MKFQLEPYQRNVEDQSFLEDMRKVAQRLQQSSVTMAEYKEHGIYHPSSICKRFGSWFTALDKAGLEKARSEINIPIEKCVADLKRVSRQLGKETLTQKEYSEHGRYSPTTFIRRYGTWRAALEENGLKQSRNYGISDKEYFKNLEKVWSALGRQPRYSDMLKPLSEYSAKAYEQKFGTWRKALEAFIDFVNIDTKDTGKPNQHEPQSVVSPASVTNRPVPSKRKTARAVSDRLRFLVFRRDNFRCRLCGAVQNVDKDIHLEADHIVPWTAGGETILDNLQTLCNRCNKGKSSLSLDEKSS